MIPISTGISHGGTLPVSRPWSEPPLRLFPCLVSSQRLDSCLLALSCCHLLVCSFSSVFASRPQAGPVRSPQPAAAAALAPLFPLIFIAAGTASCHRCAWFDGLGWMKAAPSPSLT
eukprot:583791-Rhodomonas_salina.2